MCVNLKIDTTIGSALNRSDASWRAYERSLERHGGDEFIAVALPASDPFDPKSLATVLDLSQRFESIPEVRRVDSLATVALIRADSDGSLRVDAALNEATWSARAKHQEFVSNLRRDRIAPGSLVSRDERVLAINLVFDGNVDGDRETAVLKVREILEDVPGALISGVPVVRADAGFRTRLEMVIFVPLVVVMVALLLALMFQRGVAVVTPLAVGGAGVILCLATMASQGVTVSFTTSLLPPVILALACAYTMHLLSATQGVEDPSVVREALEDLARPIVLSGATTAIGFLAMATVKIALVRDLATYGALGVFIVNAASVSLAPAMLRLWPLAGPRRPGVVNWVRQDLSRRILAVVVGRTRQIVIVWVVLLVAFAYGLTKLRVASDVILWFPPDSELRQSYDQIRARLSGITPVNVTITSTGGGEVTGPAALQAIDNLTRDLGALPKVGKALSITDPLRQVHRVLGQELAGQLPLEPELIDQYLLLLEGVDQIADVLTSDRLSANVLLRVDNNSSDEIVEIASWVERWWADNGVDGFEADTTGIMYEFARSQDEIATGGIRGLLLAVGAIGGLLLLIFRHLRLALLALVPNAVPIGVAFGFIGLVGIPLDAATVCLASLALGIAVDDTIHVITGYWDERARGLAKKEALDACLHRVLPALVFTTITIALGFGVLGISEFSLVRNLGLMTSGVVTLCLFADVLLLPALLLSNNWIRPD